MTLGDVKRQRLFFHALKEATAKLIDWAEEQGDKVTAQQFRNEYLTFENLEKKLGEGEEIWPSTLVSDLESMKRAS